MIVNTPSSNRWPAPLILALAGMPALVFYWLLIRSTTNLPIVDDYYAVLHFLNGFSQQGNWTARLSQIINHQHNEYKLVFENVIFAGQYLLFGGVNFVALSMLGNAFVIVLFVLLASTFKATTPNNGTRLLLLLPVGFLIFQLQYASTLNFSMAGLQNIPVLAFALLSLLLLTHESPKRFAAACGALLLAVCASGSGFLLAPVGGLMLLQRRRWKRVAVWGTLTVLLALIYFSNYNFHSSQANPDDTIATSATHFSVAYLLSFIGSSVARYQEYTASIAFGLVLLSIWAFAAWTGYHRENPAAFYFALFLLLTAAGVSAIRSGFGIEQSLASRYRIYSNLLLILSYMFLTERFLIRMKNVAAQRGILSVIIVASIGFYAFSNMAGYRFLMGRQQAATYEMSAWLAATRSEGSTQPAQPSISGLDPAVTRHLEKGLYKPVSAQLFESMRLGIYHPPENATR